MEIGQNPSKGFSILLIFFRRKKKILRKIMIQSV